MQESKSKPMRLIANTVPAKGWVGGFVEQHPEMNYPELDLSGLKLTDNMDNISKITRQQRVLWPEFTWETQKGQLDPKRCFQMFAPDISRIGYDDIGQSWSIICPQQGIYIPEIGSLNVEVTVTGQRGWVDETNKTLAADLTVKPKIWFSPSEDQPLGVRLLWALFDKGDHAFPSQKSRAIEINTYHTVKEQDHVISLRDGLFMEGNLPDFTDHSDEAWNHGNLEVEIGPIDVNPDPLVAEFNELVMQVFNLGSGNMLQQGNILAWNVWFDAPSLVDTQEWKDHADKWRESIDVNHCSPDGDSSSVKYANGDLFVVSEEKKAEAIEAIIAFVYKHL